MLFGIYFLVSYVILLKSSMKYMLFKNLFNTSYCLRRIVIGAIPSGPVRFLIMNSLKGILCYSILNKNV